MDSLEETFASLKASIPQDINIYLEKALAKSWAFVPEPWQSGHQTPDFGLPDNLPQTLASKNSTFRGKNNYEVLKLCLYAAMEEELYSEAVAIVFVADRYAYKLHNQETKQLLDIVQRIVEREPEIGVPPQLIIRKIRLLKDLGHYQQADKATTDVLVQTANCLRTNKWRLGTWDFKTRRERWLLVASCFQMKGIIQYNMGNHLDGAVYLIAAGQQACDLELKDLKGLGQCLQPLTDIVLEMSDSDRQQLLNLTTFASSAATVDSPLLLAERISRNAATFQKPMEFYYWKQMRKLTMVTLYQAVTNSTNKQMFYNPILQQLYECFPRNTIGMDFESQEVVLDFAATVFLLCLSMEFYSQTDMHLRVIKLAKRLFQKACKVDTPVSDKYFGDELEKVRQHIEASLDNAQESGGQENLDADIDYPILKHGSPMDILAAYEAETNQSGYTASPVWDEEKQAGENNNADYICGVDPLATTVLKSVASRQPKIFMKPASGSAPEVTEELPSSYRSLLTDPVQEVEGFEGPQALLSLGSQSSRDNKLETGLSSHQGTEQQDHAVPSFHDHAVKSKILKSQLTTDTIYRANIAKYHTLDDKWRYQKTLVYVHDQLKLQANRVGALRDVIKLQYLHQEDYKGIYVGKLYRRKELPKTYRNDVIMHQLARHYAFLFNKRLHNSKFANRLHMVPVIYMEILAENEDEILEVVNVEPFIGGTFTKMTNNLDGYTKNEKLRSQLQLLLAFTHFTWCESKHKYMVTDLQGWVSDDPQVPFILTDPAINSPHLEKLGVTNMGLEGIQAFWTKQHPTCNEVCHLLGLTRDV